MAVVNAVTMAQQQLTPKLSGAKMVVDATAGNGKDTLFLAQNTPNDTVILAFDIQQQALDNTRRLLTKHALVNKVSLINDNHANIASYVNAELDGAMFNLGYLPGGDHQVSTMPETTVTAISELLKFLKVGGLISVTAYPGYEHGLIEDMKVHNFLAGLNQHSFAVASWSMINQKNNPPILYVIEKLRSE